MMETVVKCIVDRLVSFGTISAFLGIFGVILFGATIFLLPSGFKDNIFVDNHSGSTVGIYL